MSGKDFLYSLLTITEDVQRLLEMADELRSLAIGTTASTDKEPIQSSGSKDKLGTIMSKVVDIENEINDKTDNYVKRKDLAKKLIFQIENEAQQNVLYDFFILRNPLYQVADENEMTYDACKSCRKRAIKTFDGLFEPYKTTFS